MKPFMTVPITVAPSGTIRQPGTVRYRLALKRSLLRGFHHFIESTDWEERYLCNRRIDNICIGEIVVSIIYFTPLLISITQR
jgi:hypothetical protein